MFTSSSSQTVPVLEHVTIDARDLVVCRCHLPYMDLKARELNKSMMYSRISSGNVSMIEVGWRVRLERLGSVTVTGRDGCYNYGRTSHTPARASLIIIPL